MCVGEESSASRFKRKLLNLCGSIGTESMCYDGLFAEEEVALSNVQIRPGSRPRFNHG